MKNIVGKDIIGRILLENATKILFRGKKKAQKLKSFDPRIRNELICVFFWWYEASLLFRLPSFNSL